MITLSVKLSSFTYSLNSKKSSLPLKFRDLFSGVVFTIFGPSTSFGPPVGGFLLAQEEKIYRIKKKYKTRLIGCFIFRNNVQNTGVILIVFFCPIIRF